MACAVLGDGPFERCGGCTSFERNKDRDHPVMVQVSTPYINTGLGDRVAEALERLSGDSISCGACKREVLELNRLDSAELIESAPALAERIATRAAKIAPSWWQRWGATLAPGLAANQIEAVIRRVAERPEPPTVQPMTFTDPKCHLMYHIWPTHRGYWKWHLRQLAARWAIFTGRKVLGVVVGDGAATADEVRAESESLGLDWDQIHIGENRPSRGEVVSWPKLIRDIAWSHHGRQDLCFYGHAKGSKANTEAVKLWSQAMYQHLLDRFPEVKDALSDKLFAGCFRKKGMFETVDNHRWHFSGTFYWFRLYDIFKREWNRVDDEYYGAESWPGLMAKHEESACIIGDEYDGTFRNMYNVKEARNWVRHDHV